MELDMYKLEGYERMMIVLLQFLINLILEPTPKLSQGAPARDETGLGREVDTVCRCRAGFVKRNAPFEKP